MADRDVAATGGRNNASASRLGLAITESLVLNIDVFEVDVVGRELLLSL